MILVMATITVNQSINALRVRIYTVPVIKPKDAALTPSRKPLAQGELRNLFTQGLIINIKTKAGRKITIEPAIAPRRKNTKANKFRFQDSRIADKFK